MSLHPASVLHEDPQFVFLPGLEVGDQVISRTFQPSFTVMRDGTLLCFCQGRLGSGWDDDLKVVLMNRSRDGGQTWEGQRAITSPMNHFAISSFCFEEGGVEKVAFVVCVDLNVTRNTYRGDKANWADPGFDLEGVSPETGCLLLRYVSEDVGESWGVEPITGEASFLGKPCQGYVPVFANLIGQIQAVSSGPHAGRIFTSGPVYGEPEGTPLTANFRNHDTIGSAVFYSDDNGASWQMDGLAADYLANESSAVQIHDETELLMVRRLNPGKKFQKKAPLTDWRPGFGHRIFQTSGDWGRTWSAYRAEPVSGVPCHGVLDRVGNRIYFSIPKGVGPTVERNYDIGRERGAIYFSDDEGATWNHRVIEPGTFSYSTVGKLNTKERICFYGKCAMGDGGVAYRVFTDAWLDGEE